MKKVIALFGEAERGAFNAPHLVYKLPQLIDILGEPPSMSEGLFFAIQSILYNRPLLFFRVEEEGFSHFDYFAGLRYLERQENLMAIGMPGVGDADLVDAAQAVCQKTKSLLFVQQKDFYDYLTN